ncbi:MAG TPA: MFS transporter [Chitinophagaceae bacterium]|nr:MAG: major facilitator superfamily permease [Bacteroidetes bacterium OLB11]HMN32144.1 MFS transporter [Chitinophagaceae bacterium]
MELNNKKTIRAWTYYDWANSAYSLIITSAIFPAYYTAIVPKEIELAGFKILSSSLASYSISFSFLIIALLSPLLSAIADLKKSKKQFMKFFCYMGALACIGLFFFKKNDLGNVNLSWGIFCSVVASIGFCGSIVFYNAFLPEIATKDKQDEVSAKGFAMGYIGSVILMLACLAFILMNEHLDWQLGSLPVRLSFIAVGVWWILFAQITFKALKETQNKFEIQSKNFLTFEYKNLLKVWDNLKQYQKLKKYLLAFFFYNMGVQTVMYMATYFAADELKLETTQLLIVVLLIQLVAIVGAWMLAKISNHYGNNTSLILLVLIWIGICIAAYFIQTVNQFYALATTVGFVMGGTQSLSRSTYSKLLPTTSDTASYFSFYDVCDKVGIVIGTLSFGLIAQMMGSMRNSTLGLLFFFIVGMIFLFQLKGKDKQNGLDMLC